MTITITGERLMAMYDNDLSAYTWGGSGGIDWINVNQAGNAQFVASAHEIIEWASMEYGMDEDDLRTSEELIEYEAD